MQISFIVLQAVAICGLLKPGCSFSSRHQQNKTKTGLERWFSCAKHHVPSTKKAKNCSLGFICKFTCSLKYLPCVCLLAYSLHQTALCFGAREAPVGDVHQQKQLASKVPSLFLGPPTLSRSCLFTGMNFEAAPAFLCKIVLTWFLKMVCFLQITIHWNKTSLPDLSSSRFRGKLVIWRNMKSQDTQACCFSSFPLYYPEEFQRD